MFNVLKHNINKYFAQKRKNKTVNVFLEVFRLKTCSKYLKLFCIQHSSLLMKPSENEHKCETGLLNFSIHKILQQELEK